MTTTAKYENRIGRRRNPRRGEIRSGHPRRRGRAQSGASLIEIMVVLIILLVGVFLAIRIFPAGFGVLAANDNRSRSVRLAEQLLGDTQNNAASLPQGVLMEAPTDNTGALNPILNQDPDSLAQYSSSFVPTSLSSYYTDVNRARYVKGEPIKIPVATATIKSTDGTSTFPASQYILRFGPIALDSSIVTGTAATTPPSALESSYLKIMSAPLVGYTVASNNPTITVIPGTGMTPAAGSTAPPLGPDGITNVSGYLRGQTSYLIDYASTNLPALIMFEGGADNVNGVTFYVSYSYRDTTGVVQSVTDLPLLYVNQGTPTAPALPTPVWQGLPLPTGNLVATNVIPGSVSVRRAFTRVAYPNSTTSPWSTTNPYQYILGQNNAPSGTSVNQGQIYFNPAGANYSVPTPTGQQPFLAYADYSVLDWHILHDDIQVPSVDPGKLGLIPVKTSFNLIKRAGDANPDQTIYAGLYPLDTNATDISVVNLATGVVYNDSGNVVHGVPNPSPTLSTAPLFYIDTDPHQGTYVTGTVYMNPNMVTAGSQFRILYKAEGDWAVSLQKAYSQYLPVAGAATPPTWISSTDGTGTFNGFSVDAPNHRIYFPKSDLNKSVVVTLQYTDTSTTQTKYVRTAPLQFTIDTVAGNYAYIDLVSTGTVNSQVLSSADRTGISGASSAWTVVGPILGVSVKARVIYKDNNNTNNSWRIQDVDSYLTPAS